MICLILVLLAGQSFLAAEAKSVEGSDVKSLCQKTMESELSMDQVRAMAGQLRIAKVECPEPTRQALLDMEKILAAKDVCSKENADQLMSFSDNHMALGDLPRPLLAFAVSYAAKVSELCRDSMVRMLTGSVNEQLAKDFETVAQLTKEGGHIEQLIGQVAKADIMPSDVLAVMQKEGSQKTPVDDMPAFVQQVKDICTKRFKPVYERAAGAVADLTRAGFSDSVNRAELDAKHSAQINLWNRIVFLCGSLDMIESSKPVASSPVEAIAFEPESGVAMDELEHMNHLKLNQFVEHLSLYKDNFKSFSDALRQKVWQSVRGHLEPEVAQQIGACSGLDAGTEGASGAEAKKLCGRRRYKQSSRFQMPGVGVAIGLAVMLIVATGLGTQ